MAVGSITLYFDPEDVLITQYIEPQTGGTMYAFNMEKSKAAILCKFILGKFSEEDRSNIPMNIKQDIVKLTGLKYVFTLPSVLRTLTTGAALGIALKALSKEKAPEYLVEKMGTLLTTPLEYIHLNPYLAASALGAASMATTLVSQEIASFVSNTLEGILSLAQKTTTTALSYTKMNSKFGRWTGLKAADFPILKKGQYRRGI